MPFKTEWVPPAVFMQYKDVTIYHVYRHDDVDQQMRCYSYGYDEQCTDEGDYAFDVRDLPNPHDHKVNHPNGCRAIIRDAIDAGILTQDGIQGDPPCPSLIP